MKDLSISRNDDQVIQDSKQKRQQIRRFLNDNGYSGLIIARRENFSWITTGGSAILINTTDKSLGFLVFTPDNQYLVSHEMDGQRILDEQIPHQGYELIKLKWFESNLLEKAIHLAGGKGAADITIPGLVNVFPEIVDLHYPMTKLEFDQLRWLGLKMNQIYLEMGKFLKPGLSENEIAAYFQYLQAQSGILSDVLIAGGDQRFLIYRHPLPTSNKVYKKLMLHSAACKWGLHAPITRLFSFGEPDKEFLSSYEVVANIQARVIEKTKPGIPYSEILTLIKSAFAENGFEREWQEHYQGGPTGYVIVDANRLLSDKVIQNFTPFEWFSTLPGSKIAELTLLGEACAEIVSNQAPWPQRIVEFENHQVNMPDIFVIE